MTGVVTRFFSSKGYAFLRDDAGAIRFFHAGAMAVTSDWDRLREGAAVEFEPAPGPTPDKLRASEVRLCSN